MGFRRLTILAITTAVTATAIPATAQTAAQDARFRAAQARFDREYQIYRQEVDLYQSERSRGGHKRNGDPSAREVLISRPCASCFTHRGHGRRPDANGETTRG